MTEAASDATAEQEPAVKNSVRDANVIGVGASRILYLFSGPHRPYDGLAAFAQQLGSDCVCVDKEFDDDHDLLDQAFWEKCMEDEYEAYLASPPCSTFTPARRGQGGPSPLRTPSGPGRYGIKGLPLDDKKKVTEGTILAVRAATMAKVAHSKKRRWLVEQPHWREGQTSMWTLDEFQELLGMEGVYRYTFAQCRFGCKAEKLTDLIGNIPDLHEFEVRCNHPCASWVIPWSGEKIWAPHPPLRGRQWAIPEHQWSPDMMEECEPKGDYITRSCAAYPKELNLALAKVLASRASEVRPETPPSEQVAEQCDDSQEMPKVTKAMPLRGREDEQKADIVDNSLRDVHKWVTSKARYIGVQVKNIISRYFDARPEVEEEILKSLGRKSNDDILQSNWMQELRHQVADLLERNRKSGMVEKCSCESVSEGPYVTCIRGRMLHYWTEVVGDPGERCSRWTFEGAPAGLEVDTDDLDGMFPRVDKDEQLAPWEALSTDYQTFQNYEGVEEDDEALNTLEGYHEKGYLQKFQTLEQVRDAVKGEPVLSKLGCIRKEKINDDGQLIVKTRVILDCKRSCVSRVAQRTHKAVLPRVTDTIHSILRVMEKDAGNVTLLIADVTDAFWNIPLRERERKYFVASLRGHYYVFNRTAQGSRAAPLSFAAIISIAARWVASVNEDLKLQVYVDDPIAVLRGSAAEQKRMACTIITMWSIMGFPIATHKATLSETVVWIGIKLQVKSTGVTAEVPGEKVRELDALLGEMMQSNVVSKRLLRTVIGKAMAIASVLFVWRPFIAELYTALHMEQSNAPQGCIWSKQIVHSVRWLRTFLAGEQAGITRQYSLDVFCSKGPQVVITWDASPFGMGGTLQIQGRFVEFFAIGISKDDQQILGTQAGSHEGQQTWEALCGLICLRLWRQWWHTSRVRLKLRNDNMGALTLFAQVKGKSASHVLLAREFALDLGQAQYRPAVAEHIPGIANTICDTLSRRHQAGFDFKIPIQLKGAKEVVPPQRPRQWWRTLMWQDGSPATPNAPNVGDQKRRKLR